MTASNTAAAPDILTEDEVAAMLRCSVRHVQNLRIAGRLPFWRVGRIVRYHRPAIMQALDRNFTVRARR